VETELESSKMIWTGGLVVGVIMAAIGALLIFQYTKSL
jgi:hypothetical protein